MRDLAVVTPAALLRDLGSRLESYFEGYCVLDCEEARRDPLGNCADRVAREETTRQET